VTRPSVAFHGGGATLRANRIVSTIAADFEVRGKRAFQEFSIQGTLFHLARLSGAFRRLQHIDRL
jgi:hypothetical protein